MAGLLGVLGTAVGAYFGGPAGAAIGGALGGGLDGQNSARATNDSNVQLAQDQRQWLMDMDNNKYQRTVQDMQAAGLNPMLAYSQGAASMPGAPAAKVENPALAGASSAQAFNGIADTAARMVATQAGIEQTKAQTDKIRSETIDQAINSARATAELGLTRTQTDALQQEILGKISDSATKQARFKAMNEGGGFSAEVSKLRSEARLGQLEASKQDVLKGIYELAPAAASTAKGWWNRAKGVWNNPPAPDQGGYYGQ